MILQMLTLILQAILTEIWALKLCIANIHRDETSLDRSNAISRWRKVVQHGV